MKQLYCFSIFLFLLTITSSVFDEFYDNIIIGAGIAGIGASMTLSNSSARHLIIQARDRIGGRIARFWFANTTQEMGAAFIQLPNQNNQLNPFVTTLNITKVQGNFNKQTNWYVNRSICSAADLNAAEKIFNSLLDYIDQRKSSLTTDLPVSKIIQQYWESHPDQKGFIRDRPNLQMQVTAIDNGAQLYNMSALQFDGGNGSEYKDDYAPSIGYSSFLQRIFSTYCKPTLHLNQKVLKVDYNGLVIIVTTNLRVYLTNKLFIAVPLGILKAQQIYFDPPLPSAKAEAINAIGMGSFQKLYVTFHQPFWPENSSTLHFVAKDSQGRYVQAWVVAPVFSKGLHMLIFWITGDLARELTTWTSDQIKQDLIECLKKYISRPLIVTNLFLTDWQHDPFTLGSFSYEKVGTTNQHYLDIKSVLKRFVNRIWFIGEYVDPEQNSFTHGAFKTGLDAARQSFELI